MTKKIEHALNFLLGDENDFKKITKKQQISFLKFFDSSINGKYTPQDIFDKKMFLFMSFDKKDDDCVLFSIGELEAEKGNITFMDIFLNKKSYRNTTEALCEAFGFAFKKASECRLNCSVVFQEANSIFWDSFFQEMVGETPQAYKLENGNIIYTVFHKTKFEKQAEEFCKKNNINYAVIRTN